MLKEHQLIMIPAINPSNLGFLESQHFYVISEEEIKKDDWYIDLYNLDKPKYCDYTVLSKKLNLKKEQVKKIIATTDKSLNLPQIPQSFVEEFVEEYNKNNLIKEVLVKYEETSVTINKSFPASVIQNYNLKLTSDNMIVIFKKKIISTAIVEMRMLVHLGGLEKKKLLGIERKLLI